MARWLRNVCVFPLVVGLAVAAVGCGNPTMGSAKMGDTRMEQGHGTMEGKHMGGQTNDEKMDGKKNEDKMSGKTNSNNKKDDKLHDKK